MVRIGGLAESTQRRRAYITQIAACYKVVIVMENSNDKWKKWFGDAPDDSDYEWESDDGVLFPPDIGIGASVSYKGYSFVE